MPAEAAQRGAWFSEIRVIQNRLSALTPSTQRPNDPNPDDLHRYLRDGAEPLRLSREKLIEGPPKRLDKSETQAAAEEIEALEKARLKALRPADEWLASNIPRPWDLFDSALEASGLAYGVVSFVGVLWMSGYYGALDFDVFPLLHDLEDLVLVGVANSLAPALALPVIAMLAFWHVSACRSAASDPLAAKEAVESAIKTAGKMVEPRYWASRTVAIFCGIVLVAVVAGGGPLKLKPESYVILVEEGSASPEPVRVLGSVGDFLVLERSGTGSDVGTIAAVPIAEVDCLRRGADKSVCEVIKSPTPKCRAGACSATVPTDVPTHDWSWLQQTAQCRLEGHPWVSPPFKDDSGTDFESSGAYAEWWLRAHECGSSADDCAPSSLKRFLSRAGQVFTGANDPSVNVIGLASGTSYPAENAEIARQRAITVANLVKSVLSDRQACVRPVERPGTAGRSETPEDKERRRKQSSEPCDLPIRALGYGEMPRLEFLGKRGDPSERVVLVAICSDDI
jgi:hypothetical protein